jgi:hypothetical protein
VKQKDHKALAYYLMNNLGDSSFFERRWNRRFFLLGCIGPDYLPLTYLRGFRKSHGMLGHNADYSGNAIQKKVIKLEKRGLTRWRDCLRLGTLMHYLADSFTHPHNTCFSGDMRAHRRYEQQLHEIFTTYLARWNDVIEKANTNERPFELLARLRREYQTNEASFDGDCIGILSACAGIFDRLLRIEKAVT